MVPGYIEAEEDPIQMEIQGDKRQSQSAEITALEKQPRVDGSKKHTDTFHRLPAAISQATDTHR